MLAFWYLDVGQCHGTREDPLRRLNRWLEPQELLDRRVDRGGIAAALDFQTREAADVVRPALEARHTALRLLLARVSAPLLAERRREAIFAEAPGTSSDRRWRNPSHAKSSGPDRVRPSGRGESSSSTSPSISSRASGMKYSMPRARSSR